MFFKYIKNYTGRVPVENLFQIHINALVQYNFSITSVGE